jgi:hypothetical protein
MGLIAQPQTVYTGFPLFGIVVGHPYLSALSATVEGAVLEHELRTLVCEIMKAVGSRLPASGTSCFPAKAAGCLPEELKSSLLPLLDTSLT